MKDLRKERNCSGCGNIFDDDYLTIYKSGVVVCYKCSKNRVLMEKLFKDYESSKRLYTKTEMDIARADERKKTLEEVGSKITDMALEKWGGQIGKEILADTSEVISKITKRGK